MVGKWKEKWVGRLGGELVERMGRFGWLMVGMVGYWFIWLRVDEYG